MALAGAGTDLALAARAALATGARLAVAICLMTLAGCAAVGTQGAEAPAPAQAVQTGELFLFIYRPGPAWRAGAPMHEQDLRPHGAYWQRLVGEGRAFAAGRFLESEGGMAVVIAPGADAARAILAADPAITSGVFIATFEHWRPRYHTEAPLPRPE